MSRRVFGSVIPCTAALLLMRLLVMSAGLVLVSGQPKALPSIGAAYIYSGKTAIIAGRSGAVTSVAVGRYDGSYQSYALQTSPWNALVLQGVGSVPGASGSGVSMLSAFGANLAASFNASALTVFTPTPALVPQPPAYVSYSAAFGVADCGTVTPDAAASYFLVGHSTGFVTIWAANTGSLVAPLKFAGAFNISSPNPIRTPITPPPKDIRAVPFSPFTTSDGQWVAVTGSEDGDITALAVPSGRVLTRTRYNPAAQRGINDVSVFRELVAVVNCAVGSGDKNLWLFTLTVSGDAAAFTFRSAINLVLDTTRPQVFAFAVALARANQQLNTAFFVTTEEGLLWYGHITPAPSYALAIDCFDRVADGYGAALIGSAATQTLALAGTIVSLLDTKSPANCTASTPLRHTAAATTGAHAHAMSSAAAVPEAAATAAAGAAAAAADGMYSVTQTALLAIGGAVVFVSLLALGFAAGRSAGQSAKIKAQ